MIRSASGPACAQLQAAVSLAVTLQVVLSGECLVAERALEGPCTAVERQVVFEVIRVEKPGRAVRTGIGALACMLPHVDLQFIIPDDEKEEE